MSWTPYEDCVIVRCYKRKGDDFDPYSCIEIFVKLDDVIAWDETRGRVCPDKQMQKLRNSGYIFQPERFGTFAAVKGDVMKCLKV